MWLDLLGKLNRNAHCFKSNLVIDAGVPTGKLHVEILFVPHAQAAGGPIAQYLNT